jgi:hypothetical protein
MWMRASSLLALDSYASVSYHSVLMQRGTILVPVAEEILEQLAEDGSGPVLLIGAVKQDDGTYELIFKSVTGAAVTDA